MISFPITINEFTPEWIGKVLADAGYIANAKDVAGIESLPFEGDGYTSRTLNFRITYHDSTIKTGKSADYPASIIAKLSVEDEVLRKQIQALGGTDRELCFYREFGESSGISTPHIYFMAQDKPSGNYLILLEDLSMLRLGNPGNPNIEDVELAVKALPEFHAKWWQNEKAKKVTPWTFGKEPMATRLPFLNHCHNVIKKKYTDKVPEYVMAIYDLVIPRYEKLGEYVNSGPLTVTHGDYHLKQMLFPVSEGEKFTVIDWQTLGWDQSLVDVSRIVMTGLTKQQRLEHEQRLVEDYAKSMMALGVQDFSIEDYWEQYKISTIRTVIYNMRALSVAEPSRIQGSADDHNISWNEWLFEWQCGSAIDLDVLPILEKILK